MGSRFIKPSENEMRAANERNVGGKLVIEIIQKIAGRELPLKVQTIVSYVGIALFALLFIYMLRSDILRFIL